MTAISALKPLMIVAKELDDFGNDVKGDPQGSTGEAAQTLRKLTKKYNQPYKIFSSNLRLQEKKRIFKNCFKPMMRIYTLILMTL